MHHFGGGNVSAPHNNTIRAAIRAITGMHKAPLFWDKKHSWQAQALRPLSWFFRWLASLRRAWLIRRQCAISVPIIVVGNIRVGGSGKTPMVIALCAWLQQQGKKVVVISRGYGGSKANATPYAVCADDSAADCGDEPILIAQTSHCPVIICANRCRAAQYALEHYSVDVIVSDDGLQHYALPRQVEVIMIDGLQGLGNGLCLPAGPLRETAQRLQNSHAIVVHTQARYLAIRCDYQMDLIGDTAHNILTSAHRTLDTFAEQTQSTPIEAWAGIGNPQRFFKHLVAHQIVCTHRAFADHYVFQRKDFNLNTTVLMTAKDSVKCKALVQQIGHPNCWVVPVEAQLPTAFYQKIAQRLD